MSRSHSASSFLVSLLGGALIVVAPAGHRLAWSANPGLDPPVELGTVQQHDKMSSTRSPGPAPAHYFDTGPCWFEEDGIYDNCSEEDQYTHDGYDETETDSYYDEYDGTDEYDCDGNYWDNGYDEVCADDEAEWGADNEGWTYHYEGYDDVVAAEEEQPSATDDYYSCEGGYCDDEYWDEQWESEYVDLEEEYGYCDVSREPTDAATEVADFDPSMYQGYSHAYPNEEFAYPEDNRRETAEADYSEYGYDEYGYDEYGYDEYGYDEYGYDEYGYDEYGYDEYGYDEYGYDEYGYDEYAEEYAYDGYEADQAEAGDETSDEYWEAYENEHTYRDDLYQYDGYYGYVDVDPDDVSDAVETYASEAELWETTDSDPYDCFGDESGQQLSQEPTTANQDIPCGLELFAWRPAELLIFADQEALRALQQLGGEPEGVRRARFNDYLESLGWEAIDFAFRFEDVDGTEVLALADDLPGAAAFLAAFRLVEQGELGMDEGVEVLRCTLGDVSLDWIEGIDEIIADTDPMWDDQELTGPAATPADVVHSDPVVELVVSMATRTLGGLGGKILGLTRQLSEMGWDPSRRGGTEDHPTAQAAVAGPRLTR